MSEHDYKNTLNLPKTDFAMRGNLPSREPEFLAKWQALDLYKTIRSQRKGKKTFILNDGPPYANGDIHIGHAVNKILKDIVVKSKTLSGYDAPLVPGWDCHGLPIELNVEKKLGKPNIDISPVEFRKACKAYAESQVDIQRESFIRLGGLGDWFHPYITMDSKYQADIMRSLGKIMENGHLEQGFKPVHWCLDCQSALAEAEVEYKDKTSPTVDVAFEVVDKAAFLNKFGITQNINEKISVVIWTTTPWTLPANEAVAINPHFEYVLLKAPNITGDLLLIAQGLVENFTNRLAVENVEIIAETLGENLAGFQLKHPFYAREVPLLCGDHVTLDAGTGAVHTAPAHGLDDYRLGVQHNLPLINPVGSNGCYVEGTELLAGLHVYKANSKVIEILKEKGTLVFEASMQHSYPHCWRHKSPVIFRATPQWFISMDKKGLRKQALEGIAKVAWIPSWGQSRIHLMVEGRPDWCISRQRTWGVPLPLVMHKETGALHPKASEIIQVAAAQVEENGLEAWYDLDLTTLPFENMADYEKCADTLDVWFDSGVNHACVLQERSELKYPADLYLEGSDQHRGWFQSSLLSAMGMNGNAPYKAVLTHGFVVDANGRKMSKSLGNVVAPSKVIKTLGADILRLWVSSTDYRGEIHVSDEILKRTADAYRRIRNTARFLLANLDGFEPKQHLVATNDLLSLDAWVVGRAKALQKDIIEAYDSYQFHNIYQLIHNFCVNELGSFYLDIIKDRQYTTKTNSIVRRSAQTAMYHTVSALVRWMAPILSFTAEDIWQFLPWETDESVFLAEWYQDFPEIESQNMGQVFWAEMMDIRDEVNKALELKRQEGKIGAPLEAEVILYADTALYTKLAQLEDELRFVLITSNAVVKPLTDKSAISESTSRGDLFIEVNPLTFEKCVRCWHRREDVDKNTHYPKLCGRCVENVQDGEGEKRQYA